MTSLFCYVAYRCDPNYHQNNAEILIFPILKNPGKKLRKFKIRLHFSKIILCKTDRNIENLQQGRGRGGCYVVMQLKELLYLINTC